MAKADTPNITVTLSGRLSYPRLTAEEAYQASQGSKFPAKSIAEAKPSFDILLDEANLDKLVAALNEHLDISEARHKAGEEKNSLDPSDVKDIREGLAKGEWRSKLFHTAINEVGEKTADLAPEAVASCTVRGNKGTSLSQMAIVRSQDDITDPDFVFVKPAIVDISKTDFSLYGGCDVKVTVNFYSYYTSGKPGVTVGATALVFSRDNTSFGGGVAFDEDEMFLDD